METGIHTSELMDEAEKARKQLDKWIAAKKKDTEEVQRKQHQVLQQSEEQIRSLQLKLKQHIQTGKEARRECESREQELQSLAVLVSRLKDKENLLPKEIELLTQQVDEQRERCRQLERTLAKKEKTKQYNMQELTKGISYYRERLGLDFTRIGEDQLCCVFTLLDPADPDRQFRFSIYLDEESQYHLGDCKPHLEGLSPLLQALNSDNDFAKFVRAFRKKFKDTLNSSS
ncbi:kinetochore-associated Ndc80 complex subunit spc25 [Balamuthia mandrillaris]